MFKTIKFAGTLLYSFSRELRKVSLSSLDSDAIVTAENRSKLLVEKVNEAVAFEQNRLKLAQIQADYDTSGLDPYRYSEYIWLNKHLTEHTLLHEGGLRVKWKDEEGISRRENFYVLVLNDFLLFLEERNGKFVPKPIGTYDSKERR